MLVEFRIHWCHCKNGGKLVIQIKIFIEFINHQLCATRFHVSVLLVLIYEKWISHLNKASVISFSGSLCVANERYCLKWGPFLLQHDLVGVRWSEWGRSQESWRLHQRNGGCVPSQGHSVWVLRGRQDTSFCVLGTGTAWELEIRSWVSQISSTTIANNY